MPKKRPTTVRLAAINAVLMANAAMETTSFRTSKGALLWSSMPGINERAQVTNEKKLSQNRTASFFRPGEVVKAQDQSRITKGINTIVLGHHHQEIEVRRPLAR